MADLEERRAARVGALTRDEIATTALRLFTEAGLTGLSMRRLGAELGVHYSTLYWHVADKEELLRYVLDAVLADVHTPSLPAAGESAGHDWYRDLVALFTSLRKELAARPGAASLLMDLTVPGPSGLAVTETALSLLRGAGLSEQGAQWAYMALKQFTASSAHRDGAKTGRRRTEQAAVVLRHVPPEQFPNVTAAGEPLFAGDTPESFGFGLAALLTGLLAIARDG